MSEEEQKICQGVSDKLLDTQVSDYHIAEIANDLVEWEDLGPFLDLTESEQKEIVEDFQGRYNLQKRQALRVWRWKNGDKATYRALISICCSQGLVQLAETIASYLGSNQRPRSSQIHDTFHRYLLDCYVDSLHPSRKQWPGNKLPMLASTTFLDLNLLEAPLHEYNSPGNNFKEVTLTSVLSKRDEQRRMIVYFEGIAGSGKTTLSWYACREWAKKKLLGEFQLLINLQLNDPQLQSATCPPDIIPYPDKNLRQEIATTIVDCKGKGVCFLLDGLDEISTNLLDFLLGDLIQGKFGSWQLPELSFMLTSRPVARVTVLLESIIESRILMSGFNRDNLDKLLDDRLGATSEERGKLVEEFKINPRLEGLCSHPINAVIMTFLVHFLEKGTPTTQTDLFKPLVCNLLIRHMSTRFDKSCKIDSLVDDESIPCEIRKPFRRLCSLAYIALCENKRLFTKEELDHNDLNDTLGFLHVHSTVTMFGYERYYSFDHLSIQEFLAAIHLARMRSDPQSNAVKSFLYKSPRSQILSFYAGLTGLSNEKVLKVLSKSLETARDAGNIVEKLISSQRRNDPQQEALTFLKCLFECKNDSLWELPETELHINPTIPNRIANRFELSSCSEVSYKLPFHTLSLRSLALTPLDCLSLGYYINAKSFMPKSQSLTIAFDLNCSTIDPTGLRLLFTELKKGINYRTEVRVQLNLSDNKFNKESVLSLKELLRGQSNLEYLHLINSFDPSVVDLNFVLKSLIEGLSSDSSCELFDLSDNHFNSSHVHYFILMLRYCPQLISLTLASYDLSRVMPLFSSALLFTTGLIYLNVSCCNISDSILIQLGKKISTHRFLVQLIIYGNPFTDDGLTNFLRLFMTNSCSQLRFLETQLPPEYTRQPYNQSALNILENINWFRLEIGYPFLVIDSLLPNINFQAILDSNLLVEQFRKHKDSC